MGIVSYAQNLEDVVLWRVLGNIEHGTYVDVGAADPEEHSVTHAFYSRGWSGINIEPTAEHFEHLVAARPRDLNLQLACAREPGLVTLHAIAGTGLSTLDSTIAERHQNAGWRPEPVVVPALPLSDILRSHVRGEIHFLKIDVEGSEPAVIAGTDLATFRPWIIIVESTAPLSTVETSGEWEPMLLGSEYEFAYFDGLNRFYVAAEQRRLIERLAIPPNVFDEYERIGDQRVRIALDFERGESRRLLAVTERPAAELAARDGELKEMAERLADAEARFAALQEARQADVAQLAALQTAHAAELDELRIELQRLRDSHATVESRARQLGAARTELEGKLARAESSSALLQGALEAERANAAAAQREIALRAEQEIRAANERGVAVHDQLQLTLRSRSWRITAPIRVFGQVLRDAVMRRPPADGSRPSLPLRVVNRIRRLKRSTARVGDKADT